MMRSLHIGLGPSLNKRGFPSFEGHPIRKLRRLDRRLCLPVSDKKGLAGTVNPSKDQNVNERPVSTSGEDGAIGREWVKRAKAQASHAPRHAEPDHVHRR